MMKFTDSHCHLDFPEFDQSIDVLLNQCHSQDIHRIVIPGVNPEHWDRVIALTHKHRNHVKLSCALGIHPWLLILHDKAAAKNTDLTFQAQQLDQALKNNKNNVIAIGECGIDVFKAKKNTDNSLAFDENIKLQQAFFEMQLNIAKQYNLPVIVHHCQSHALILPLLKQYQLEKGGVIHAFSGSYQQAKEYIDLGFKLGLGGTITYSRAKKTINAIKRLPLSSFLIETDAPAMPPMGMQGQHNSPLNLLVIFKALVDIRDEPAEHIAQQLEVNVEQLFFSNITS